MAKKTCCICKKSVGFFERNALDDGFVCDECWEVATKNHPEMKDPFKYTVEQVKNLYRSAQSTFSTKKSVSYASHTPMKKEDVYVTPESKYSLWDKLKIIGSILSVLLGLLIAWMGFTNQGQIMFMDIMGKINPSDNAYVVMVQALRPLDDGRTYKTAFDNTFINNDWTYYKSGGTRYVKVVSYDYDPQDTLTTKFKLKPTGDNGDFWIEPYSMEINGYDLGYYEMYGAFAVIFGEEVIEELLTH